MEKITDWQRLWAELCRRQTAFWEKDGRPAGEDVWRGRARKFSADVGERWRVPDSSRDFIASVLKADPDVDVLDIGAGVGAWTIFMAPLVRRVTALEPSRAMIEVMEENLARAGITNVHIVQGAWPEAEVPRHDVVLSAHALYGCPDLGRCVQGMAAAARRTCFLLLRAPLPHGIMAEVARRIWGQPYDSPNFQVAYNALLEMGVLANVLVERPGFWMPWSHATQEEALDEVRRRFDVVPGSPQEDFMREVLERKLTWKDGRWVWPVETRAALIWWDVAGTTLLPAPSD